MRRIGERAGNRDAVGIARTFADTARPMKPETRHPASPVDDPSVRAAAGRFDGGGLSVALLIVALLLGIGPTLSWLEFASGSENLNVATVLEMHREGNWLVPTLNGEPRLAKPPLTAWTSAALLPEHALRDLDSPVQDVRDAAYERLALYLRLPALVLACGVTLATYWLGRAMVSARFGFASAAVCASSVLFLRFGRSATTDIQLACWVAVANAVFASLAFREVRLWKLLLMGVALGLALLAKGPVAFAQTCAPWALFALFDPTSRARLRTRPTFALGAAALVIGTTLAIGVPWFAYILLRNSQAWSIWWMEVTREGATMLEPDEWYSYFSIILLVLPWTIFFLAGIGSAAAERSSRAVRLVICLLIVPIVLMSLAKDKNDRYLVPLLPAASMVVALALRQQFRAHPEQNAGDRVLRQLHWGVVAVALVSIPVLGATGLLKTEVGEPWYGTWLASALLIGFAALAGAMIYWSARSPGALVPATLLCMLSLHAAAVWGYRDAGGRSELKPIADVIREQAPEAPTWFYDPPEHTKIVPADLSVYLNRKVRTARDEPTLMQASAGAVVVMLQRKGTPDPAVAGWTPIDKRGVNGRYWWALRRDALVPTTQP